MPNSRPSSSSGRRPANATLSSSSSGNARRSGSSSNLLNNTDFTSSPASGSGSGISGAMVQSTSSSGKRRQSDLVSNDGHAATTSKVGPRRKSKVGISGLGDHAHHVHHAGPLARKKNASSTALSRKDKSRSHLALTQVANELVGLSEVHDSSDRHSGHRSGKSKERKPRNYQQQDYEEDHVEQEAPPQTAVQTKGANEPENEGGWESAASSAAATPVTGTSPVSPESYKALEFGKKSRRKKAGTAANAAQQVVPLQFPTYEQRQTVQRTITEDDLTSTTPRQRESALSLAAPKTLYRPEASASATGVDVDDAAVSSSNVQQTDIPSTTSGSVVTADTSVTSNTADSTTRDSSIQGFPSNNRSSQHPSDQTSSTQADQVSDLPQQGDNKPRPSTMRKTSTSTIRSLASLSVARPAMSSSIRRQAIAPLQPRLDTSAEGTGEIKHIGLVSEPDEVTFPSQSSSSRSHRRQNSANSFATSRAGTLAPREAEELAKRLRTVSGSGLPPSSSTMDHDFDAQPARGTLRRSASTAHHATLASMQKYGISSPLGENTPQAAAPGGALGTLKRASGYFGSFSRLASIGSTLGLTSLDQSSTNPSPTSPAARRTPSSGGSLAGAQNASSPVQRLQNAYGLRNTRNAPLQVRQPLISKFIDPSESYNPFPAASTSPTITHGRNPSHPRGVSSRARQKLLTQRDYPDDLNQPSEGNSVGSDEDPMASQVNLRKNLSSKNLSGSATPLQPGVQRWLVALSKEAERIDKDHETFYRFHDTLQASFARILEKRAIEEQEEQKAFKERGRSDKRESPEHSTSRPSSVRSRTMA